MEAEDNYSQEQFDQALAALKDESGARETIEQVLKTGDDEPGSSLEEALADMFDEESGE